MSDYAPLDRRGSLYQEGKLRVLDLSNESRTNRGLSAAEVPRKLIFLQMSLYKPLQAALPVFAAGPRISVFEFTMCGDRGDGRGNNDTVAP